MRTVTYNKRQLRIYDSVDELPIVNFQKYNKYLLIDAGIGSDVDDIDQHINKIVQFMNAGEKGKAAQELQNMRQNLYMIGAEISPKNLAFAALIHSVDGKEVTDLSDDGLKSLLAELGKVKQSALSRLLDEVKKKVQSELELYFPKNFDDPKEKELYDTLKQRILLVLDSIIEDKDNDKQIAEIDISLLLKHKPKCYVGASSEEIAYEKHFETTCLIIAQKTGVDPKKLTLLQYYNALDMIKSQAEAEAKSFKLPHSNSRRR